MNISLLILEIQDLRSFFVNLTQHFMSSCDQKTKSHEGNIQDSNAEFEAVSAIKHQGKKVIKHYKDLWGIFNKTPATYMKDS